MEPFTLRQLIFYFLKLGTVGFGGPIALIGYMQKDLVEEKKWFSEEDYLHGVALAQMVPGPLAMQLAIYFGYLKGKIIGATLVAVTFILIPFIIVCTLGWIYMQYHTLAWIHAVFYGMAATVIGVIAQAALNLAKISLGKKPVLWSIALAVTLATAVTGGVNILYFLGSGLFSLILFTVVKSYKEKKTLLPMLPSVEMFFFFMKAAVIVYGSGMAIIPFIYADVVGSYQWLNNKEFLDAVAVGMITPGPVMITVGFIGYLVDGLKGAASSVVGIFLPVYLFVILFVPFFRKMVANLYVNAFVRGVTAAACGAIAGAVWILGNKAVVDYWSAGLAVIALLLLLRTKIPVPLLLLGGGLIGFILHAPSSGQTEESPRFQPKSMAYVLQPGEDFGSRDQTVEKLGASGRDLIVLDYSFAAGRFQKWKPNELKKIRKGKEGRKIVSYISIGEAEDYRAYWHNNWDADKDGKPDEGAPSFLREVNPDWAGNYKVKYWDSSWQKIILLYIDEIIDQGFDGVYLDIVDAFQYFENLSRKKEGAINPETNQSYQKDMVDWILKITAYARKRKHDFLIISQNGSQLLRFPEFVTAISAIGLEDFYTLGNSLQPEESKEEIREFLAPLIKAGKTVLTIEYPTAKSYTKDALREAKKDGFILLITDRLLMTLGESSLKNPEREK